MRLISNLPEESRVYNLDRGGPPFSFNSEILSSIQHYIAMYMWSQIDKKERGAAPEMQIPTYIKENIEKAKEFEQEKERAQYSIEEIYANIYGGPTFE